MAKSNHFNCLAIKYSHLEVDITSVSNSGTGNRFNGVGRACNNQQCDKLVVGLTSLEIHVTYIINLTLLGDRKS